MTCALCQGEVGEPGEGTSPCPHCGAVMVVVSFEQPAWIEAIELEEEDA